MSFEDLSKNLNLSEEAVKAIPEDLRNEKSLEPIKDFSGILKSYVDGQKMIGGSLRIPKEDAKPEEWDAFYGKLGRPESADKYDLTLPKPEKIDWDDAKLKMFRDAGFKLGMNHNQMHGILGLYADMFEEAEKSIETGRTAALQALEKDWGAQQGAGYQKNLALVKRAVDIYGEPEAKEYFNTVTEVGNNPLLVRMIAKMAADLDEADFLGGEGNVSGMTSEEAKAEIAKIATDANDLYHAKFNGKPGHNERVAEVEKLYQIAYPRI